MLAPLPVDANAQIVELVGIHERDPNENLAIVDAEMNEPMLVLEDEEW